MGLCDNRVCVSHKRVKLHCPNTQYSNNLYLTGKIICVFCEEIFLEKLSSRILLLCLSHLVVKSSSLLALSMRHTHTQLFLCPLLRYGSCWRLYDLALTRFYAIELLRAHFHAHPHPVYLVNSTPGWTTLIFLKYFWNWLLPL